MGPNKLFGMRVAVRRYARCRARRRDEVLARIIAVLILVSLLLLILLLLLLLLVLLLLLSLPTGPVPRAQRPIGIELSNISRVVSDLLLRRSELLLNLLRHACRLPRQIAIARPAHQWAVLLAKRLGLLELGSAAIWALHSRSSWAKISTSVALLSILLLRLLLLLKLWSISCLLLLI